MNSTRSNRTNEQNDDANRTFLVYFPASYAHGLCNQLQCLHLAATLAKIYSRVLVLPKDAVQGSIHDNTTILVKDLFSNITGVDYEIWPSTTGGVDTLPVVAAKTRGDKYVASLKWNALEFRPSVLQHKHSEEKYLLFPCSFGYSLRTLPHVSAYGEVHFHFHERYKVLADRMMILIHNQIHEHDFRGILGVHIRLGDSRTNPILTTSDLERVFENHNHGADSKKNDTFLAGDRVLNNNTTCHWNKTRFAESSHDACRTPEWSEFIQRGLPMLAQHYSAVLIATNRPEKVRAMLMTNSRPAGTNIVLLDDIFKMATDSLNHQTESANRFLTELLMLIYHCQEYIPSLISSATDLILRYRLAIHPNNQRDLELNETFWKAVIPEIVNRTTNYTH